MADRLIEEEDREFQRWYDNLGMKYDMMFDLHDDTPPALKRKLVSIEARKQGLGYVMKDGRVAVKDSEMPYASVTYQSYPRNIDCALSTFESGWNGERKWRRVEFKKYPKPLFLKPSADIEMTVEFLPIRILYRPKRIRRIRVSTGTSLITRLIETLRSF